ncbi:MAG: hypothetical protein QNK37_03885 [Acidobacteriota bacterium]|nr:hypothetical protein [Acidobacteriota bacterium]
MSAAKTDLILIIGFALFLALPLTMLISGIGPTGAGTENRVLAPPPQWADLLRPQQLTEGTERWFNDRFGMRNQMIQGYNRIKLDLFQTSPTDKVTIGRDGWLYLTETVNQKIPEDPAFYDRHFQHWKNRRDRLAEKGIPYLFVLVPDKKSIYPEYLHVTGDTDSNGRFAREMAARGDLSLLDLGPALRARKGDGPLYFRNDSHWNFYGSLTGYRAIAERLQVMLPGFQAETFDDIPWSLSICEGGGLARMLGFPKELKERTYMWPVWDRWCEWERKEAEPYKTEPMPDYRKPQTWTCPGKDLKVLLIHDSFMTALRLYLAQNFGRTTFVWDYIDQQTLEVLIEREKPDLVIEQHVTRLLLMQ